MRLGLGIGIDKTNIAAISGGLRARFLGTGTQYTQLGPITRQISAAMTGDGTQTTDLLVTKRFAPNYTGDGTMAASLLSYEYLLSGDGDAAVAYSLRAVNPDYTGVLVLLRRSSDNAEKAFYKDANNILSLTSEDGASVTLATWIGSDNGFVKTKYDQSGNSNHATNTTASEQPQIIAAGAFILENTKPTLQGNGTQYLKFTNLLLDSATGYFMSIVYRNNGADMIVGDNNSTNSFVWPNNGTNVHFRETGTDTNLSITTNNGAQSLLVLNRTSGNIDLDVNANNANTAKAIDTININTLLNGYTGTSFALLGNMQEVIIYATDKSASKADIKTNVNTYYSIY